MPFYFSKDGKISNDYKLFFHTDHIFLQHGFSCISRFKHDFNVVFFFVWTIPDMCLSRNEKKEEERKTKSFRAFSSEILILILVLEPFFIVFEPDDYCLDLWFPN